MMAGTDFSAVEIPDVVETLRGLRVFKVDHVGFLHSLYYAHTWVAGVNVGRCLPSSMFAATVRRVEPEDVGHEDWLDCRCGIYGYTDGSNTYANECDAPGECFAGHHRQISGLIEVWGRLVVGPRGFRAEKARIVALVMPDGTWPGVRRNYEVPTFPTVAEALAAMPLTPTERLAAA